MNNNFPPTKDPATKNAVLVITLSVFALIIAILSLPWHTQVVAVNDYFYSISKAGAQDAGVLPVTLPLVAVLIVVLIKPKKVLNSFRLRTIFFAGLWVTGYSVYYFCAVTAGQYTTPGFGALAAIIGGVLLMFISIVKYAQKNSF